MISERSPGPSAEYLACLSNCVCCPRECRVDRFHGSYGYCQTGAGFEIASICLHRGEEPVLTGKSGICNIFFSRCNLQCVYCQNYQISRNRETVLSRKLTLEQTIRQIEKIMESGVKCVGFVSPSHVLPQMEMLMQGLKERGRNPVFVMNTNAYDKAERIAALEDRVQVYLPDLKYLDTALAARLSDAPDYPEVASRALQEMFRQKGPGLKLDPTGVIESGLIVRHLVLPGQVENSKRVLRFVAEELSPGVHISLMSQYSPIPAVACDPDLGRYLSPEEYGEVVEEMERLGLEHGWVQETAGPSHYKPDFARRRPFKD